MGGLFGGQQVAQPTAAQPTAANGVSIQTSCFGKVKPVVIGPAKIPPNLLWYNDFQQHAVSSGGGGGGGGGGGKGGGGGSGGGGTTSYTYSCSLMLGLCEGPVPGIGAIWQGNDATATTLAALGYSAFLGAYGQTAWPHLAAYTTVFEQHEVPLTAPYQVIVDYTAAPFVDAGVKYGTGDALTKVDAGPASGQYAVDGAGTYTFAAADAGAEVTIGYSAANQEPPTQALSYSGLVHIAAANYDLGSSATLPNHNVEVFGFHTYSVAGHVEADPSLFALDLTTNPYWGVAPALPSDMVGDLSLYQSWCIASGLLIGIAYTEQQAASQVLDDLTSATHADVAWPSEKLVIIPRGDTVISGNGVTYTPPPFVFDFTDDNWLISNGSTTSSGIGSANPLSQTCADPVDAVNQVPMEYVNRGDSYNPATVTAQDLASIRAYGLNADTASQVHLFNTASAARTSAQLKLQRAAILTRA